MYYCTTLRGPLSNHGRFGLVAAEFFYCAACSNRVTVKEAKPSGRCLASCWDYIWIYLMLQVKLHWEWRESTESTKSIQKPVSWPRQKHLAQHLQQVSLCACAVCELNLKNFPLFRISIVDCIWTQKNWWLHGRREHTSNWRAAQSTSVVLIMLTGLQ